MFICWIFLFEQPHQECLSGCNALSSAPGPPRSSPSRSSGRRRNRARAWGTKNPSTNKPWCCALFWFSHSLCCASPCCWQHVQRLWSSLAWFSWTFAAPVVSLWACSAEPEPSHPEPLPPADAAWLSSPLSCYMPKMIMNVCVCVFLRRLAKEFHWSEHH